MSSADFFYPAYRVKHRHTKMFLMSIEKTLRAVQSLTAAELPDIAALETFMSVCGDGDSGQTAWVCRFVWMCAV